jgi:RimJ/RimL family protein N-acetyltransferase
MTGETIAIRAAADADADRLLGWSNDPLTRAAGFHVAPIAVDDHRAWFDGVLADPSRGRIWIGLEGSRPVGSVRVALTADGVLEVGIMLDAAARGTGRSRPLLEAGLAAARVAFPGRRFRAWIRADNAPSLALFAGAGFRPPARPPARPPGAPGDAVVVERD